MVYTRVRIIVFYPDWQVSDDIILGLQLVCFFLAWGLTLARLPKVSGWYIWMPDATDGWECSFGVLQSISIDGVADSGRKQQQRQQQAAVGGKWHYLARYRLLSGKLFIRCLLLLVLIVVFLFAAEDSNVLSRRHAVYTRYLPGY